MHGDIENMDPQHVASAALNSFFNITERWGLTAKQQCSVLGNPAESTFKDWMSTKAAKELDPDTLERISYILGIYKALNIIYSDKTVVIRPWEIIGSIARMIIHCLRGTSQYHALQVGR